MSSIIDLGGTRFKSCPMCKTDWNSMESFLADPQLVFNGYQPNFGVLEQGIFFFTHDTEHCGSTMALKVQSFASLYNGPKYTKSKQLSADCPRYCLDEKNLKRCNAHCENAFAREIAQLIKQRMAPQLQTARGRKVPGALELR